MSIELESLVSATDLNRNSGQLLARAGAGERLVVLSQNRPLAAIISVGDLRRLQDLDKATAGASNDRCMTTVPDGSGTTTIGLAQSGAPVALRLCCNTLILGRTGTGKSVTFSAALASAREDDVPIQIVAGAGCREAAVRHRSTGRQPPIVRVIGDPGDDVGAAGDVQREILDEFHRRQRLLSDAGAGSMAELHSNPQGDSAAVPPNLVLMLDEISYLDGDDEDWLAFLSTIVDGGSRVGIYVWLCSQGRDVLPMLYGSRDRSSLFPQLIVHHIERNRIGEERLGREYAALIRSLKCGRAVVQQDGGGAQLVTVTAPDIEPQPLVATAVG